LLRLFQRLHLLHLLRNLVRVQHARNGQLEPPLVVLGFLERGLAFVEEEVGIVFAGELADLGTI
jgi:hypothetical protein